MVTAVTEAAAATVEHIVVFAAEEGVVESAVGALGEETAAEASTVVTTLYDQVEAAPAPQ